MSGSTSQPGNQPGQRPTNNKGKSFDPAESDRKIQNALQHLLAIDLGSLNPSQKAQLVQRFAGAIGVSSPAVGKSDKKNDSVKPKKRSAEETRLMAAAEAAFVAVREASNGGQAKLPADHKLMVDWSAAKVALKSFRALQESSDSKKQASGSAAAAAATAPAGEAANKTA